MPELIFLGTGAAGYVGSARQLSSTYFDGLLLDCSAGTVGRLEDVKSVEKLKAVLISHVHSDHYAGLFDLLVHLDIKCIINEKLNGKRKQQKLFVYCPEGLKPIIRKMAEMGKVYEFFFDYLQVNFIEVQDGMEFEVGDKKIKAILMDHKETDSFGYLINNGKFKLFYTGDTMEPSALEKFKVDYLIHEATFTEKYRKFAKATGHSTGKDAAEVALKTGAKKLFLTHVNNNLEREENIYKEAKEIFAATVLPNDLDEFHL